MKRYVGLVLVLVVASLAACATGGSTMNSQFRENVGEVTPLDASDKIERVLRRYQFEIARYEDDPNSRFWETRWKSRVPFDDEYAMGVNEARNRIVVQLRPKRRTGGNIDLYNVYLTVENMVMTAGSSEWVLIDTTPDFEAWAGQIAQDLSDQFRLGIRTR